MSISSSEPFFFDFLRFDLMLTVGMVFSEMISSSEAEELDELVTVFLAMYDLLPFPFEDL